MTQSRKPVVFNVHWLMLWAGPYGSTYCGIYTGGLMLVLILMLVAGGIWPSLLEGRIMSWSNKLTHRYITYGLLVVLTMHIFPNGSHFAFLR